MNDYLAVDIGASGGRHILGWMDNGRMHCEEIYRFSNGMQRVDGHLCWDTKKLLEEIKNGMKQCARLGRIPVCMGIDTWAVDYVLLDGNGHVTGRTYGYRDSRTDGADRMVYEKIAPGELYARTGIQKQIFNTIYQLAAQAGQEPEVLEQAESLLLIPDYFNYCLTGVKMTEYTNATTTQLVSPVTRDWDRELIGMLGIRQELFTEITPPGTRVGRLTEEVRREVGFDLEVYQVGSHDTASAVAAVPALTDRFCYISSGTWSLMGTELSEADCSAVSCAANFTNEGGYEYRYRFLKNIMGLWMIQNVKKELGDRYDFAGLCDLAGQAKIDSLVDCGDPGFLAPESMTAAVRAFCAGSGQQVPETPGELARVIYRSLADCYGKTASELERITGEHYPSIYIVGGGSKAAFLNQLTADASGKTVYAGPGEGTAIGSLAVQMITKGELDSIQTARRCIHESFEVKEYKPQTKQENRRK